MKLYFSLLLVFAAGLFSLQAKPVVLSDDFISLVIPDDWTQLDNPPGTLLKAEGGPDGVQIVKSANPRNIDLNPDVVASIKKGMSEAAEKHGGTLTFGAEGPLTLGGAPAYSVQAAQTREGRTDSVLLEVVDANRSLYAMYLTTSGSLPDTTLQGVSDSFRFTIPPTLPQSNFERRAYKIGLAAGVLLALVAAGLTIRYFVRRT